MAAKPKKDQQQNAAPVFGREQQQQMVSMKTKKIKKTSRGK
jgi:hypothetical protein